MAAETVVSYYLPWASLVAQLVKNPPAMQETPVWFLGQEDPLEKGTATHSNTLATWYKELTHGKDPDAGKDWRHEEKGMTEDEETHWNKSLGSVE